MGLRINTNVEAFTRTAHSPKRVTGSRRAWNASQRLPNQPRRRRRSRARHLREDACPDSRRSPAQRNCYDGISMMQTAEGSLQEFHSILHRIRDLAVQYNNGVYDLASQQAIIGEVAQLSAEISRMIGVAQFNGIPLLSVDTVANPIMATLQVGANNGEIITVGSINMNAQIGTAITDFIAGPAYVDINSFDTLLNAVSSLRAGFGAIQNRSSTPSNPLSIYEENLSAACSPSRRPGPR